MAANYDFTCQNCGLVFNTTILDSDPELVACPNCGKSDLVRHFPAPAVHVFYSPAHPRHKRGMVNHKAQPSTEPQFRADAPFLKKRKKRKKNA
jgi:putative FmdB family regulatory protein